MALGNDVGKISAGCVVLCSFISHVTTTLMSPDLNAPVSSRALARSADCASQMRFSLRRLFPSKNVRRLRNHKIRSFHVRLVTRLSVCLSVCLVVGRQYILAAQTTAPTSTRHFKLSDSSRGWGGGSEWRGFGHLLMLRHR